MKIWINRTEHDLGDFVSDTSAAQLRALGNVPADYDLYRVADFQHREWLKGPMVHDEKVSEGSRVYFGSGIGAPPRFYTAPRIINGSSTPPAEVDS